MPGHEAMKATIEVDSGRACSFGLGVPGKRAERVADEAVDALAGYLRSDGAVDRWLDPRHRYFKVRGDDGGIYILRHDTARDRWELTLFDSGTRDETRLPST
jgi:RNA 3'-terminal phosphate cyclase